MIERIHDNPGTTSEACWARHDRRRWRMSASPRWAKRATSKRARAAARRRIAKGVC